MLGLCAERGIAVVPFGGGTSVVGGLAPAGGAAFVALDLRRMNAPGLGRRGLPHGRRCSPACAPRDAEARLAERGYTLGHFPQSFEWASIGGFAAARSSGQASAGYGRFDDMVVGLHRGDPGGHPRPRPGARSPRPAPICGSSSSAPRAPSA